MKNEIELEFWEKNKKKSIKRKLPSTHPKNKYFLNLKPEKILDIYNLSRIIFNIEKELVYDYSKKRRRENLLNISKVRFTLNSELTLEQKKMLGNILSEIFLLLYRQNIIFEIDYKKVSTKTRDEIDKKYLDKKDAILLFSGGLDSMIGLEFCEKKYDKFLMVYVSQKRPRLKQIITKIKNNLSLKDKIIEVYGPPMGRYFANTNGLVYMLTASIFSYLNKCPIIIGECGVTSYQPRYGPLNDITYTTHPLIIESVKSIYSLILGDQLEIILPFNDSTKSEMVRDYGNTNKIKLSHSCLSSHTFEKGSGPPKNCGKCYACLIRRLSIIPVMNDPTEYTGDLTEIKKEMIVPVIEFCYTILKDLDLLDYPQKEKIIKYHKKDLFKRFSLDTLSSLYKISKEKNLPFNLSEYIKDFPDEVFEERLKILEIEKRNGKN